MCAKQNSSAVTLIRKIHPRCVFTSPHNRHPQTGTGAAHLCGACSDPAMLLQGFLRKILPASSRETTAFSNKFPGFLPEERQEALFAITLAWTFPGILEIVQSNFLQSPVHFPGQGKNHVRHLRTGQRSPVRPSASGPSWTAWRAPDQRVSKGPGGIKIRSPSIPKILRRDVSRRRISRVTLDERPCAGLPGWRAVKA